VAIDALAQIHVAARLRRALLVALASVAAQAKRVAVRTLALALRARSTLHAARGDRLTEAIDRRLIAVRVLRAFDAHVTDGVAGLGKRGIALDGRATGPCAATRHEVTRLIHRTMKGRQTLDTALQRDVAVRRRRRTLDAIAAVDAGRDAAAPVASAGSDRAARIAGVVEATAQAAARDRPSAGTVPGAAASRSSALTASAARRGAGVQGATARCRLYLARVALRGAAIARARTGLTPIGHELEPLTFTARQRHECQSDEGRTAHATRTSP
jgi:hypothetical protein